MAFLQAVLTAAVTAGALSPVAAAAPLPKGDVVFILDESGSMGDEIADIRADVSTIAARTADRVDARYGLVSFGGGVPGHPPNLPFTRSDFTTARGLSAAVQQSGAFPGNGGGEEVGLDATTYAMTKLTGFRPDAATCAVVISDEAPSFRVDEASDLRAATGSLAARHATWFGVVEKSDPVVRRTYGSLAASSGGATFAIGDFRSRPSAVVSAILSRCARAAAASQPGGGSSSDAAAPGTPACTIRGTSGRDVLRGTSGRDVICGLGGNDVIDGRGGDDVLIGGPGADKISGGAGADVIDGGAGADKINGGTGADTVTGGAGADFLTGGSGRDVLRGGGGADRVRGGAGKDVLRGGAGKDRLLAADRQRDTVDGGAGRDVAVADRGLDRLRSIHSVTAGARR